MASIASNVSNHAKNLHQSRILTDLLYLLAGIDTSNVFVTDTINCSCYDINIFKPFEFLIYKIREFYKIEEFDLFVQSYLKKLAVLKTKVSSIEELLVEVQEDIEIFKDLSSIKDIFINKELHENSVYKASPKSRIFSFFKQKETIDVIDKINKWINQSNPTDLVSINKVNDFNSCYWKNLFKIKPIDLRKSELKGIEECGKIIYLARALFGIELVNDIENLDDISKRKCNITNSCKKSANTSPQNQNENMIDYDTSETSNQILDNMEHRAVPAQLNNYYVSGKYIKNQKNDQNLFHDTTNPINESLNSENSIGTESAQQKLSLLNIQSHIINPDAPLTGWQQKNYLAWFNYNGQIQPWHNILLKTFSSIVKYQLFLEISLIEEIVFLQNGCLFNNFYTKFKHQLFTDNLSVEQIDSFFKDNYRFQIKKLLQSGLGRDQGIENSNYCVKNKDNQELLNHGAQLEEKCSANVWYIFPSEKNNFSIGMIGDKRFDLTKFISITDCKFKLGDYIIKLLKYQKEPIENVYLTVIQKVGISINDGLIRNFLSEKTIVEMNLIFRFLFFVTSVTQMIQDHLADCARCTIIQNLNTSMTIHRDKNFLRVIHLIFNKIRDQNIALVEKYFLKTDILSANEITDIHFEIENFTENISENITEILSRFYITDADVFQHWSVLFDISVEFILLEFKDQISSFNFNQRVKTTIQGLVQSIIKSFGENDFTEFIKNMDIENVLG